MTKIKSDEVLFEIRDGIEYATLRADTFRTAMRQRDFLQAETGRLTLADKQWADLVVRLADRRQAERADVEHDLAAALLLDPFNDTREILDLLTHALAIVQEPGAVNLHKKSWSP